jgi:hypothetical protein
VQNKRGAHRTGGLGLCRLGTRADEGQRRRAGRAPRLPRAGVEGVGLGGVGLQLHPRRRPLPQPALGARADAGAGRGVRRQMRPRAGGTTTAPAPWPRTRRPCAPCTLSSRERGCSVLDTLQPGAPVEMRRVDTLVLELVLGAGALVLATRKKGCYEKGFGDWQATHRRSVDGTWRQSLSVVQRWGKSPWRWSWSEDGRRRGAWSWLGQRRDGRRRAGWGVTAWAAAAWRLRYAGCVLLRPAAVAPPASRRHQCKVSSARWACRSDEG